MAKKICPNCKKSHFKAQLIHAGIVNSNEAGEFDVEAQTEKYSILICECAECNTKFPNGDADLISALKCSVCGKETDTVDEQGRCLMCMLNDTRKDLVALSQEELLRRLLNMEGEIKTLKNANKQEAVKEEAKPVTETVEEPKITDVAKAKVEAAQEVIDTVLTGRKKLKNKSAEAKAEEPKPVETQSEVIAEIPKEDNSFMNPPFEETTNNEPAAIDMPMFSEESNESPLSNFDPGFPADFAGADLPF